MTLPDLRQLDPTRPIAADAPPPAPRPNKPSAAQELSRASGPTTGGTVVTIPVGGINRNASVTFFGQRAGPPRPTPEAPATSASTTTTATR